MKHKRKHTTTDKARRLGEIISQKQPDAVAPSGHDIADMIQGMSFDISIGRKERKNNERIHDKTPDDSIY